MLCNKWHHYIGDLFEIRISLEVHITYFFSKNSIQTAQGMEAGSSQRALRSPNLYSSLEV